MPINPMPAAPAIRQPRTNTSTPKTPKTTAKTQVEERTEGLMGLAQIGYAICIMTRNYADAGAIEHFSPNLCRETAKLADSHEKLGAGIDSLNAIGPYTAILTAALPLVTQVLANHNRIPVAMAAGAGAMDPKVLEAEIKTDLMRKQTEALAAQREAQKRYEDAQAALNEENSD